MGAENNNMKILVIGAGASLEESIRLKVDEGRRSPLINNFASTLWTSNLALPRSLILYIRDFLAQHNQVAHGNEIDQFIQLEKVIPNQINIERLFEYAWINRNNYYPNAWDDLLYGAIVNPLVCLFASNGFHENGVGWKKFTAYQTIAKHMRAGDLVVNLNYEPLFEMGALQAGCSFVYSPNDPKEHDFIVSKPHGSMNLIVTANSFYFAQPDIIGSQMTPNENRELFRGIIPPRYNKAIQEHPISKILFNAIQSYEPRSLAFWGVGFTGSDRDILDLYKLWSSKTFKIDLIHPDKDCMAIKEAEILFNRVINHYPTPEAWTSS